jgi:hypothetical protein
MPMRIEVLRLQSHQGHGAEPKEDLSLDAMAFEFLSRATEQSLRSVISD